MFTGGRLTDDWYYGFVKRHHDQLQIKKAVNMPINRVLASDPLVFKTWYNRIQRFYDDEIFHERPNHIFNCDEIGILCDQGQYFYN